jgi:hypothetical protein
MRFKFRELYGLIDSPAQTRNAFVDFYADNYQSLYQERAARALGEIGRDGSIACRVFRCGNKARRELQRAFVRDSILRVQGADGFYRLDVLAVIRSELTTLNYSALLPLGGVSLLGSVGAIVPPDTVRLQAQLTDIAGQVLPAVPPGVSVAWLSDADSVATVTDGLVTAVNAGVANIFVRAAAGPLTFTDSTRIEVTPQ